MDRSDPELIQACHAGDQLAWNQLIERYGRLVYSIPRRIGLGESDADDVFAAVWATAYRKLDQLRDQKKLSAWLITTAHRESWRVGRQRGNAAALSEQIADDDPPGPEQAARWERQHLVRRGLEELGGKCRDLLEALFLSPKEADYQAIGRRLDMPAGSIGPTRARCFKKLEAILVGLGLEA